MVDRQTPTVKSDEETAREAEATREAEANREAAGEPETRDAAGVQTAGDRAAADAARSDQAAAAVDAGVTHPGTTANDAAGAGETPLFSRDDASGLQDRWLVIQTKFVDEPRRAVEEAESLVGEVMKQLTESFARERQDMEHRWSGKEDVSTEDLRLAIRRYRSFFNRLLSI